MRRAAFFGMIIGAALALGCHHRSNSTARPPKVSSTVWDHKTVEMVVSAEPGRAKEQLRQQMQAFQAQGWVVLAVSKPLPQNDGTVIRRYELKREKQ